MNQTEKKQSLLQNWMSVIGAISSIIWFTAIVVFFILDFTGRQDNPYLGIITYFIFPIFFLLSLAATLLGAWKERKRRIRGVASRRFPQIDFNNPVHQRWAYVIWAVSTVFFLLTVIGSYRAYEFTESVKFCGQLCHQVMQPEYIAYQNSPHARVTCVQCHIGPGVDWFIKSKISGSYQVYSVLAKKYPRPIETPVKNLRPAQETCEQCHWPQQFFGAVEQDRQYFSTDEENKKWKTRMLMFVGGGLPSYGRQEGIHWHMNIKSKTYYIATDKKRQVIPWIKVVSPDGQEEFFIDKDSGFSPENPPKGEMRLMDCMDCHNRPSHVFRSPVEAVDEAMAIGNIDSDLPFIKREAVKALSGKYTSHEDAVKAIEKSLQKFYQNKYPEIWEAKKEHVTKAIQSIAQIYQTNFFPEMKVSWKEYPDNIGHLIFPGCFRCHDDKHVTKEGKAISRDCTICHNIIEQGSLDALEKNTDGLPFRHPFDEDESWKEMNCSDCHTGN